MRAKCCASIGTPCQKGGSQAPLGAQDEGGRRADGERRIEETCVATQPSCQGPEWGEGEARGCWTQREGEPTPET